MRKNLIAVDLAEESTILAALRFYQQAGMGNSVNRSPAIDEIATNSGTYVALDDAGIDELCENINSPF